jgi:hypothetical protein
MDWWVKRAVLLISPARPLYPCLQAPIAAFHMLCACGSHMIHDCPRRSAYRVPQTRALQTRGMNRWATTPWDSTFPPQIRPEQTPDLMADVPVIACYAVQA